MQARNPSVPPPPGATVSFGPARDGWIRMLVSAGGRSHEIACSEAYDPFPALAEWALRIARGGVASVEIDEERVETALWLVREPGSALGRLRVLSPLDGADGPVVRIDAAVDVPTLARSLHEAMAGLDASIPPDGWGRRLRRGSIGGPAMAPLARIFGPA